MKTQITVSGYVDGQTMLKAIFPARTPSMRWLHYQKKLKRIPYVKLGNLVFYDVEQVRRALQERHTINAAA